jgi:hypothetical protein
VKPGDKKVGLDRVRRWPRADIEAAAKLTRPEQELLVEAAALLDIRPCEPPEPGPHLIEIP